MASYCPEFQGFQVLREGFDHTFIFGRLESMTNLNHRILALFIPFVMMAGDGNWKLTKEKNNITTFIGPGNETGLKPTRSVMNVPLTTEETLSAILDFDRYKDWVPYCEESKLVDNQGDTLYHFFQMLDMPLIKNRDMYIRVEVNRFSKNEVGIRMIGAPTY